MAGLVAAFGAAFLARVFLVFFTASSAAFSAFFAPRFTFFSSFTTNSLASFATLLPLL